MFEFAQYSTKTPLAPPRPVNTELDMLGVLVRASSVVRICDFCRASCATHTVGPAPSRVRTPSQEHSLVWLSAVVSFPNTQHFF